MFFVNIIKRFFEFISSISCISDGDKENVEIPVRTSQERDVMREALQEVL